VIKEKSRNVNTFTESEHASKLANRLNRPKVGRNS